MSEQKDSCVQFNRNIWHRRLHDLVYGKRALQRLDYELKLDENRNSYYDHKYVDREINLCPYMRRIIWACVLFPFLIIWRHLPQSWQYRVDEARAIVVFAILCAIAHTIIAYTFDVWYAGLVGFFGGMGIAFGVWGLVMIVEKIKWRRYEKRLKDRKEGKERKKKIRFNTGLIWAYFHAKHEKICPCIEFVDEVEQKVD